MNRSTIWYDMIWCDMIWYNLIWYNTVWYEMIWYDMVRYYLTLYRFSCNQYKVWHSRNRIFFYYILQSECVILLHENLTKNFLQTLWRCSKEVKEILLTSFILKCLLRKLELSCAEKGPNKFLSLSSSIYIFIFYFFTV